MTAPVNADSTAMDAALKRLEAAHAELARDVNAITLKAYEDSLEECRRAFEPLVKRAEARRMRSAQV
jgi:hypothetical protein